LHPSYRLVGGIDKDVLKRRRFTEKTKVGAWRSIDDLIRGCEEKEIGCVAVATGAKHQLEIAEEVIQRLKPKVLVLEKPVAEDGEGIERIKKINENSGTKIFVNYQRVYLSGINSIKRSIIEGKYGRLLTGSVIYGKGLIRNGTHFINLLIHLFGSLEVAEVGSKCVRSGKDIEADFIVQCTEAHDQTINLRSVGKYGVMAGEIDLWFERARIIWRNQASDIEVSFFREQSDGWSVLGGVDMAIGINKDAYQLEVYDNIMRAINGQESMTCDLALAIKSVALALVVINRVK